MNKLLLFVFTITFATCFQINDLQARTVKETTEIGVNVDDGSTSLDLSRAYPNLIGMTLSCNLGLRYPSFKYTATHDAGLSKNKNLRSLRADGEYSQNPIALSYLPLIENYNVNYGILGDFDYLEEALPNLKTLSFWHSDIADRYVHRSRMGAILENIGKLQCLETLIIDSKTHIWGDAKFTDREFEALSKMYNLKKLDIALDHGSWFRLPTFDQEQLKLLKLILPNTDINVRVIIPTPRENLPNYDSPWN